LVFLSGKRRKIDDTCPRSVYRETGFFVLSTFRKPYHNPHDESASNKNPENKQLITGMKGATGHFIGLMKWSSK
jgi:hypothetical protein